MIKAKKGNTAILGLSDENIMFLTREQRPIKVYMKDLQMGDGELIIFNGRDEKTMEQMLKSQIGPETKVIDYMSAEGTPLFSETVLRPLLYEFKKESYKESPNVPDADGFYHYLVNLKR
jgi:hypothetical protein